LVAGYAGVAGTPFVFTVLARDNLGNVRGIPGDDWQVRAVKIDTGIGVLGSCFDELRNGTVVCQYVPTITGTYLLGLTLGDSHVRDSPYVVNVTYAPLYPAMCNASGFGITVGAAYNLVLLCVCFVLHGWRQPVVFRDQNATVDTPVEFIVYNRDMFGNSRPIDDIAAITVTGNVANVSVAYNGSNRYLITYTPTFAGTLVDVLWLMSRVTHSRANHVVTLRCPNVARASEWPGCFGLAVPSHVFLAVLHQR
jgi:hypothetical protein